jgi:hypothetical protein
MISAVDTNVLLDILIPNADYAVASLGTLEKLSGKGSLVISEMVFAELSSQFPSLDSYTEQKDDIQRDFFEIFVYGYWRY